MQMSQQKLFTFEHLNVLCKKGISVIIVLALALNLIHKTIMLTNGVSDSVQDSDVSLLIFSSFLLNFFLISSALFFQIIHSVTQKGGFITKLVIISLLISFGITLNLQYTLKSLISNEVNAEAVEMIQKDILLPCRNQCIIILVSLLFLLIQEVFVSKSALIIQFARQRLGACMVLPMSQFENLPSEKNSSAVQASENSNQSVQIQLIDLVKKSSKIQEQKIQIEVKISPNLLKTDENVSSDIESPQMKLSFQSSECTQKN